MAPTKGGMLLAALSIGSIGYAAQASQASETFPGNTFGRGTGEAFVQLFLWKWTDIAKECEDFLGPKGYKAVQISPPSEHQVGVSWDANYRPVSFKLVSRLGNEAEFKDMVTRCKAVGVGIYADIVVNQFAGPWGGVGIAGTSFRNRAYGDLFTPEDFHHLPGDTSRNCGVDNYQDEWNIQYCDLLGMPDVCTECPATQDKIADYINHLHSLGVAGIRIDAAKHQSAAGLQALLDKVSPDLYRFLEVFVNYNEAVSPSEYFKLGQITEFGFGFNLGSQFTGMSHLKGDIADFGESWGMMPSDQGVVFIDNHDTQRNNAPLTFQKNEILYVMASVFMLAWNYGYPKVMSSFYFTDVQEGPPDVSVHGPTFTCGDGMNWVCEHRWPAIANMVNFRKTVGDAPITHFSSAAGPIWKHVSIPVSSSDANGQPYVGNTLSFCRGDKGCIAINKDALQWTVTLQTDMPAGQYCDVSQDDGDNCPFVTVGEDGKTTITLERMSTVAFHVGKQPLYAAKVETIASNARLHNQTYFFAGLCVACVMLASAGVGVWVIRSRKESDAPKYALLAA